MRNETKAIFFLHIMVLPFIVLSVCAQAKPVVLSSIKPLTLIAQEVVGDSAVVDTLLPTTASPHDYPLKASDYSRLQKADVVLWVGPELESFLQKPLANLKASQVITAYLLPNLNWPAEEHHLGEESEHHHERDPHLWLDPRNAIAIARVLSETLSKIDSTNKAKYSMNLQVFIDKTMALDVALTSKLKALAGRGFAVYHEGYGHFVDHYGLYQLDYVAFTPEQRSGAKHLRQLREKLAKEGVCLFLEPYYELQSLRNMAQELGLRLATLDALGSQNVETYEQLLSRMAQTFSACLGGALSQ